MKKTTIPIRYYLLILLVAIILIILLLMLEIGKIDLLKDILLGLSTGLLSSALVSLLVDIANTMLKKDSDKKIFELFISSFKRRCSEIPCEINTVFYEMFGYESDEKRTFEDYVNSVFSLENKDTRDKHLAEINYFLQSISDVKESGEKILDNIHNFYDNQQYSENFEKNVKLIIYHCKKILECQKEKKYDDCKKLLVDCFKNSVLELYPDLDKYYVSEYDEEVFIE